MFLPSPGGNNYLVQPPIDFIFQLLIILTIFRPIIFTTFKEDTVLRSQKPGNVPRVVGP
jgi:hypothetical protein